MKLDEFLKDYEVIEYSKYKRFSPMVFFQFYKDYIFYEPDHILIYKAILNESLGLRRKYVYLTLIICFLLFSILGFDKYIVISSSLFIVFILWIVAIPTISFYRIKKSVDTHKIQLFEEKYIQENYSPLNRGEIYQIINKGHLVAMFSIRRISANEILTAKCTSNTGILENFIVKKDFQGKGIGSLCLTLAENSIKAFNYEYIGLSVVCWNDNGRNFYKRRGFKYVGIQKIGFLLNTLEFWIKKL